MQKYISPLELSKIKEVAKRLRKSFPEKNHMQMLDITARAITGASNYREAEKLSDETPKNYVESRTLLYARSLSTKPTFKSGDWYFFPDNLDVVFEGEFSPYPINLTQLSTSSEFLDFILQIQKKKWPGSTIKEHGISPTYQVDEFITLISRLCEYYLNNSIQGVYSPGGKIRHVDWPNAILQHQNSKESVDYD